MASNEDGTTPGADVGAENTDGKNGDAAGNAADKTKPGEGKGDKPGEQKAGQVVFDSQEAVDRMIQQRIDRATKKLADDAKLTKEQQLERERDDALKAVRERDLRDSFIAETGLDVAKGRRVFAMYKDELDVDDKGKASNMADVVKAAKKDFPEIFGKSKVEGGGDGGSGSGGRGGSAPGGSMNDIIRKAAGR